jgi:hypothetical protein
MSENSMKYLGLCSTCKNASSCKYPRDPDKPVFYCEEFEIEKIPLTKPVGKEQPPVKDSGIAKEKDSTKFIGLCSNCDNRRTCSFPKPEGGVWHCEEYR